MILLGFTQDLGRSPTSHVNIGLAAGDTLKLFNDDITAWEVIRR